MLSAFSFFLLYKLDSYVKNEYISTVASQLSNITKLAFKTNSNIMYNAPSHNILLYDVLKGQQGYKDFWLYRSDVISNEKGLKKTNLKDTIERKVNLTKSNESSIAKIDGIGKYQIRVSTPIIASNFCLECHSGLQNVHLACRCPSQRQWLTQSRLFPP